MSGFQDIAFSLKLNNLSVLEISEKKVEVLGQ